MYTLLKYCYKVVKSLNLILILIKEVFRSFRGSLTKFLGLQVEELTEGCPTFIEGGIVDGVYSLLLTGHRGYARVNLPATAMFGAWMCDPWSLPFGNKINLSCPHGEYWRRMPAVVPFHNVAGRESLFFGPAIEFPGVKRTLDTVTLHFTAMA